jgi:hypothetical protein
MKPKLLCLFILVIFTIACHQPTVNKVTSKKIVAPKALNTRVQKKENKDTLIITAKCAVRINLDTAQLDKLRKKYGDEAFYTGADDGVYYSSIADSLIHAKHLPLIANKQQKYLKFVQNNGAITMVKIDTLPQASNYYFFEPAKAPYEPDLLDIEEEYQKYYNR